MQDSYLLYSVQHTVHANGWILTYVFPIEHLFSGWIWIGRSPFGFLSPLVLQGNIRISDIGFSQVRCAACYPTNSVKALKKTYRCITYERRNLIMTTDDDPIGILP